MLFIYKVFEVEIYGYYIEYIRNRNNKEKGGKMIIKIEKSEKLDNSELENFKDLKADYVVYYYEYGSYEGSGFAVWKKDGKYGYSDLSHCSCYGPTDDLSTIYYNSLNDIEKFCNNYNFGSDIVKEARKIDNFI
jgi:hypothetical protein